MVLSALSGLLLAPHTLPCRYRAPKSRSHSPSGPVMDVCFARGFQAGVMLSSLPLAHPGMGNWAPGCPGARGPRRQDSWGPAPGAKVPLPSRSVPRVGTLCAVAVASKRKVVAVGCAEAREQLRAHRWHRGTRDRPLGGLQTGQGSCAAKGGRRGQVTACGVQGGVDPTPSCAGWVACALAKSDLMATHSLHCPTRCQPKAHKKNDANTSDRQVDKPGLTICRPGLTI